MDQLSSHESALLPRPPVDAGLLGRYQLLKTIAYGGMAEILLASDLETRRLVVVKRILPHFAADPEFVQFFIHEGRLGRRLRHTNLVETIDSGQEGQACYIALEYLRGRPVIELLRAAGRAGMELPLGVAVRVVADAARGLHHAHVANDEDGNPLRVVHRDVTPHNLFVCADGVTKVLDFGIAKAASQLHQTRTGTIKGKFAYLAPEQIRGQQFDHRVDVFALGIVLYELLTQRPLFRGSNDGETLQKVLTLQVEAPERLRKVVPPGLGAVALRALQRDPDRRLPSAEAMADSIEAIAAAEGIDSSPEMVARLMGELCPVRSDDLASLVNESPPQGLPAIGGASPPTGVPALSPGSFSLPPNRLTPTSVPALGDTEDAGHERLWAARFAVLVGFTAALVTLGTVSTCRHQREASGGMPQQPAQQAAPQAPLLSPQPPAPPLALEPLGQPTPVAVAAAPPGEATLRVQTDGSASFTVDGQPLKPAFDGALHMSAGHHRVVVSGPQFVSPRALEIDLRPKEAAVRALRSGRGHLRVVVNPWAEVVADGRPLGVTPLAAVELTEGVHQIALRNGDLGVVSRKRVVIVPGRETVLKADLFSGK